MLNASPQLPQTPGARLSDAQRTELLEFAANAITRTRGTALAWFRRHSNITNKAAGGAFDPLTDTDLRIERQLRTLIHEHYPEHGILGEEYGYHRGGSTLTWVIDPIDGTRAFVCGLLHWGVLLALCDGQRPLIGACYQPYIDELYISEGGRTELWQQQQKQPLQTRSCTRLADAIVCCTTPQMFTDSGDLQRYQRLAAQARLVRYGTDCYGYCMIAHGCVDAVVESNLAVYDVQAMIPIVEGAGGIVSDWQGGSASNGGNVIACGDRALHAVLLAHLNQPLASPSKSRLR